MKTIKCKFYFILLIKFKGRDIGCYSGLCDISTDENNNIYICDSGNHRILKFSETGEFISQWGSNGSEKGELNFNNIQSIILRII